MVPKREIILESALIALEEREDPRDLMAIDLALRHQIHWERQDYQIPPPGDWWTWVFQGGRGTGKTDSGAVWLDEHMKGPPCDRRWPGGHKALLLGPTYGDVMAAQVKGATGLRAHNPQIQVTGRKDGTFVVWPNRAEAVALGMHSEDDADRIRAQGGNVCTWWIDEAAIGRHLATALSNLAFGARGSLRPHGIATTTPKATPAYRAFLRMPKVVVTKASSMQNRHLPQFYRDIVDQYRGTRLGRQEIEGELLEDYEGALWQREDILRINDYAESYLERVRELAVVRIGVGIDPSTWIPEVGRPAVAEDYEVGEGVETGLVVAGVDRHNPPRIYVFDDLSGRMAATEWAKRASQAYHDWGATWVVPETNAGGDTVLATIQLTDPRVTFFHQRDKQTGTTSKKPGVRAAMGKRARAEPVAAVYQQKRAFHVGEFPALEAQLCGWDPTESWSPDRLDALVWAVTALEPWRRRRPAGAASMSGTIPK
jgi:phage terminase large subunit-like protein